MDHTINKKQSKFPASSNQRCWINGELVNCDNLKINEGRKVIKNKHTNLICKGILHD